MLNRYRQVDISTASPVMLVVKLYEGAIRQATEARVHAEASRIPERARAIGKALAIVGELQSSLDLERGGEVGENLHNLYGFVTDRLLDANLNGHTESIDEAVGVLSTLVEGWREIAQGGGQQS